MLTFGRWVILDCITKKVKQLHTIEQQFQVACGQKTHTKTLVDTILCPLRHQPLIQLRNMCKIMDNVDCEGELVNGVDETEIVDNEVEEWCSLGRWAVMYQSLIYLCLIPYGLHHLGVPIAKENVAITSRLTIMLQKTLPLHHIVIPKSSHQLDAHFFFLFDDNEALASVPLTKGIVVVLQ